MGVLNAALWHLVVKFLDLLNDYLENQCIGLNTNSVDRTSKIKP